MAKIGIYGSSFDPITNIHLWTASTIAHRCKLDRVIFLPSSNQRTDKQMHISDRHVGRDCKITDSAKCR